MGEGTTGAPAGNNGANGGQANSQSEGAVNNNTEEGNEGQQTTDQSTEQTQTQKLHKLFAKMKDTFKDKKFEKDEDYLDTAFDHVNELEGYKTENQKISEKLVTAFKQYPEIMQMMKGAMEGQPLRVIASKIFKAEDLQPVEGDEQYEALKKIHDERLKKAQEDSEREKLYESNRDKSIALVKKFIEDNKINEYQKNFAEKLDSFVEAINRNEIPEELLSFLWGGMTKDSDIKNAIEQATVKTKNEKIVAKQEKEEEGDGLADIGASGKTEKAKKIKSPIHEIMDTYNKEHRNV